MADGVKTISPQFDPGACAPSGKCRSFTDVNANLCKTKIEDRIAQVARPEIKLLLKAWSHLRDVRLAVFSQITAIAVDHCGGVVVNALLLHLTHGYD